MYLVIFTYLGKNHLVVYDANGINPDSSLEIHEGIASIHIEKYLEKWKLKKEDAYPINVKIYSSDGELKIAECPFHEISKLSFIPISN